MIFFPERDLLRWESHQGLKKCVSDLNDLYRREPALFEDDFTGGGDRVRYVVDTGGAQGPFSVEVELWYQPIGYRWAHNLSDQEAPEIERFIGYYEEMAGSSSIVLAGAKAIADRP